MTERITADDVAKVAKLARLRLTDDELERFTAQLGAVLDHAADLQRSTSTTSPRPPTRAPPQRVPPGRARRAARPRRGAGPAPSAEDGQFRVPPILGEAP